jgi:beta-glucanase (GH16 family)
MYFDDLALNQTDSGAYGNWNITWSDEFNEASLNPKVWTYDTGGGGWGNSELEYYTTSSQNSYLSGGLLHIAALRQATNGSSYTSARIKSEGLYARKYGRFEWRARLPAGVGFWPALWMLGANVNTAGWPGCGEIDVVENRGSDLTNVQGSLHSGSDETEVYTLPGGSVTNFHTYTLDWTTNAISFYVDGLRYETQTNWTSSVGSYPVPFNQPFFIIMNLAVGGNYVNNPTMADINANSTFPGELQVDYVRVYDVTPPLQLSASNLGGEVLISRPTNIVCHLQSASTLTGAWTDLLPNISNPYRIAPASTTFYRLASP